MDAEDEVMWMEDIYQQLANSMAQRLDRELLINILGLDGLATTTTNASSSPTLTWEQLIGTIEELRRLKPPLIYYYAHNSIPKFDEGGNKFIMQGKFGNYEVFFFHPDWLFWLRTLLGRAAGLLVEFDIHKWLEEEGASFLQRAGFVKYGKHWVFEA
jgi:hypothetical protein